MAREPARDTARSTPPASTHSRATDARRTVRTRVESRACPDRDFPRRSRGSLPQRAAPPARATTAPGNCGLASTVTLLYNANNVPTLGNVYGCTRVRSCVHVAACGRSVAKGRTFSRVGYRRAPRFARSVQRCVRQIDNHGHDHGAVGPPPLELRQGEALSLHVYIDGGAIEVIANNRTLVTAVVLPPSDAFVHVGIVGCASPLRHYEAYVLKDLGPPRPRDMFP